ncbi:MAG: hypothetical protein Q9190_005166 [Brigantiaea leucoxantha]
MSWFLQALCAVLHIRVILALPATSSRTWSKDLAVTDSTPGPVFLQRNTTVSRGYFPIHVPIPQTLTSVELHLSREHQLPAHSINSLLIFAADRIDDAKIEHGRNSRLSHREINYGRGLRLGVDITITAVEGRFLTWQLVGNAIKGIRIYRYVKGLRSQVEFQVLDRRNVVASGVLKAHYGAATAPALGEMFGASKRAALTDGQVVLQNSSARSNSSRPEHGIKLLVEGITLILWRAKLPSLFEPFQAGTLLERASGFARSKINRYDPQRRLVGRRCELEYEVGIGTTLRVEARPPNRFSWRVVASTIRALTGYRHKNTTEHEISCEIHRSGRSISGGHLRKSEMSAATSPLSSIVTAKRAVRSSNGSLELGLDTSKINVSRPIHNIKVPVDGTPLVLWMFKEPSEPLNSREVETLLHRVKLHIGIQILRWGSQHRVPGWGSPFTYNTYVSKTMMIHYEASPPNTYSWGQMSSIVNALNAYNEEKLIDHALSINVVRNGKYYGKGFLRIVEPPPPSVAVRSLDPSPALPGDEWIHIDVRDGVDIYVLPGQDELNHKYLMKLLQRCKFLVKERISRYGLGYVVRSPWHQSSIDGFVLEVAAYGSYRITLEMLACVVAGLYEVIVSKNKWVTLEFRVDDESRLRVIGALRRWTVGSEDMENISISSVS